jgi:hypothetical protein
MKLGEDRDMLRSVRDYAPERSREIFQACPLVTMMVPSEGFFLFREPTNLHLTMPELTKILIPTKGASE